MTQRIYSLYDAAIVSQEMNERFTDMLAGSVLSGFRLAAGTDSTKVSLVKGGDTESILITWTGVRVVEDADVLDALTIVPNVTATDRLDTVYVNYVHGDPEATAAYLIMQGNADGTPVAELDRATFTYLGQVRVPANGGVIGAGDYASKSHGIDKLEFAKGGVVHGDLALDGKLVPTDTAGTRAAIQVYSQNETQNIVDAATAQFPFEQVTPAAVWNVQHNLNRYPSVVILDGSNNLVTANINYPNADNVTITFATAFAGKAYLY